MPLSYGNMIFNCFWKKCPENSIFYLSIHPGSAVHSTFSIQLKYWLLSPPLSVSYWCPGYPLAAVCNTARTHLWIFSFIQVMVHPKDRTPHTQKNNLVYAVQCSEECSSLYIGETKQKLSMRMAQHRRANSSGQDSAVHLHLKETTHSFEDENVHILDREERWFERGVREAIYVKVEKPSLNRGGGLRHHLSPTYNAVLSSLPRRFNNLASKTRNTVQTHLAPGASNNHRYNIMEH